jgi:hypothetical protein
VASDLFAAYGRLLESVGREMSVVVPTKQPDGKPLIPFSMQRDPNARLAIVQYAIGPALRNAYAWDAETHWRRADATMLGFALAESHYFLGLATQAQQEAAALANDGEHGQADLVLRSAVIRTEVAAEYARLVQGEGW